MYSRRIIVNLEPSVGTVVIAALRLDRLHDDAGHRPPSVLRISIVVVKDLFEQSDHHHNHPHHLASLASMVSSAIARHRASSAAFSLAFSSRGYWYLGW